MITMKDGKSFSGLQEIWGRYDFGTL